MYQVFFYNTQGVMVILQSFTSVRDAWAYGRKWRRAHGLADSEVYIQYQHGSHGKLIGNLAQVAMTL